MAKAKTKQATKKAETDSAYLLKLVLYLIVGAQWLRLTANPNSQIPIPVGLIVGLLFASHDHFQIDRKVEYAVLLMATLVGFWSQVGVYISL